MARKKNMESCRGLTEKGLSCPGRVKEGKKCCSRHKDMEKYSEYEFANLQKCTRCSRSRWRFFPNNGDRCEDCQEKQCPSLQKDGESRCRNNCLTNEKYCNDHIYFKDYTEEQLGDLKQCSDCCRFIYRGFFDDNQTCQKCRNGAQEDRNKQKEINKMKPKCNAPDCNYLAKNGNYCVIHNLNALRDFAIANGNGICRYYNHGFATCEKILPSNHPFKACNPCLARERQNDKNIIDKQKKDCDDELKRTNRESGKCIICHKICPIKDMTTHQNIFSYTCVMCRIHNMECNRLRNRKNTDTNESNVMKMINGSKKRGKIGQLVLNML